MSSRPETMSDQEAADRLGFKVRRLRPVIDQLGLCLRLAEISLLHPTFTAFEGVGLNWPANYRPSMIF